MNPQLIITSLAAVLTTGKLVTGLGTADSRDLVEMTRLTDAASRFSQRLYQEVGVGQTNTIYSPFSAHVCLSMAYMGARGETAQQMATTLQVSGLSSLHTTYRDLLQGISSAQDVELLTSNAIFMNPAFHIKQAYQDAVTSDYFAISENIDMAALGGPEAPINAWIASKTENMITSILPPGSITDNTLMLLINTIFFNGTWNEPFEERMTRKASFNKADGSVTEVDLMHQTKFMMLKQEAIPNVDVVRIPFKNRQFALYVALPRSNDGLPALEAYITDGLDNVNALFQDLQYDGVDLYLPKFKLSATMKLNTALKNMGMSLAFSERADFSGMTPSPRVFISEVVQKAVIDVQENGTVATAATVVHMLFRSGNMAPISPVVFKADHPFLYFLRDDDLGQILFQGKLKDPEVQEWEIA